MYGQYTAGAWQYIGRQGILQSTYETLAECARQSFDGTLRGRIVLSAGLGAMGSAQPIAAAFLGGVSLICEVDETKIERALQGGYLDVAVADAGEAASLIQEAARDRSARSVGLAGNAADLLGALHAAGLRPDVVTDQTSAHDTRYGYVPSGFTVGQAEELRRTDPERHEREALASIRRHVESMLRFQDDGAIVFEYGNAIREQAARAGLDRAFDFQGFVPLYIRPNFCVGRGPCRWVALSGDPADIETIDRAMLEAFADDDSVTSWIRIAMEHVPHQGLPARTSWFAYAQRLRFATLVNDLVASGPGPRPGRAQPRPPGRGVGRAADARDRGDAGRQRPDRGLAGAERPAEHGGGRRPRGPAPGGGSGMGGSISAGMTVVIDGTEQTQERLERLLRTDPGIGVIRHADAGYESALATVRESDLVAPMIEHRDGARGPAGGAP